MRFISASQTQPPMEVARNVRRRHAAGSEAPSAVVRRRPATRTPRPLHRGACDNSGFLAAQHAHVNHAEVTFCGTVVRLRPAKHTRSGWHRYVYVDVGHNNVVEIDATSMR